MVNFPPSPLKLPDATEASGIEAQRMEASWAIHCSSDLGIRGERRRSVEDMGKEKGQDRGKRRTKGGWEMKSWKKIARERRMEERRKRRWTIRGRLKESNNKKVNSKNREQEKDWRVLRRKEKGDRRKKTNEDIKKKKVNKKKRKITNHKKRKKE